MNNKLTTLFTNAKGVYEKEGLITLFRRTVAFLLHRLPFRHNSHYLVESVLKKRNEADFIPKIQNFTFKIIETTKQLDELSEDDFDLSFLDFTQARQRFEKGAMVFCIFVKRELAFKGWFAMTDEAKKTITPYPYKVDFVNKEACTGDAWTNPKYRRQGLYTYGFYQRQEYLIAKGVKKTRTITLVSNEAMIKAHDTIGVRRKYAKARYLRIGRLQFWKETPIEATENNN